MNAVLIPSNNVASRAYPIQYPSGRWGFVGNVPAALAYEGDAELISLAAQFGPGVAVRIAAREGRQFNTLSWATEEEAKAARRAVVSATEAAKRAPVAGLIDILNGAPPPNVLEEVLIF